jgi:hypothetical protein
MATTTITIEGYKQLKPRVVNLFQENNRVDTIIFSLAPYIQGDVDLSDFDCYVVTYGVGGVDQQKLPFTIENDTMLITWTIDNYTLSIGQTLSYQIVFKSSDDSASVWHSYKGILFCDSSIDADERIVSNYPTILRQFERRIEEIATRILYAYEWMPLGIWTPVSLRTKRRFYLNRQTDYDYTCLIEDDSGKVISPLAKTIVYEPGQYSISESLQNVIDYIMRQLNWCTKFCANDGNITSGHADLLSSFSGTLSFKVGDSFPSLTATLANGETFTLPSVPPMDCSNLPNGDYDIFLDKFGNTRALSSRTFRQHTEPATPQNNDIWYNASTNSAKIYDISGCSITQISCPANENIISACRSENTIIAISSSAIFRSTTDGLSWSRSEMSDILTCCAYENGNFLIGTADGNILYSSNLGITWSSSAVSDGVEISSICYDGVRYYCSTRAGKIFSTAALDSWLQRSMITDFATNSIVYHDGTFLSCGDDGKIFRSIDAIVWTAVQSPITDALKTIRWIFNNTWTICCPYSQVGKILQSTDNGQTWSAYLTDGTATLDVGYINGAYFVTTLDKVLYGHKLSALDVIPGKNRRYNTILDDKLFGSFGKVAQILYHALWCEFNGVPIGKISVINGEISSCTTFPYNQNWFDINSETIATPIIYGALRVAGEDDEQSQDCSDAAITPANIFRLLGYRKSSTAYSIGDIVGCPYHPSIALKCTTAGTTSDQAIDLSGEISIGDTIVDGTVTWGAVPSDGEASAITSKGDIIVGDDSGKQARLGIGSNGQFLMVSSSGTPQWADIPNPITSEGDIIVGDSNGNQARLPIGSPGKLLAVNSDGVPAWLDNVVQTVATLRYWS